MNKVKLKEDALKFLQRHKVATVATVTPEGQPQAATVTFICDDDFNFYFAAKPDSRKVQNIRQNPRIAIVVGTEPNAPATAQIEGTAEIVSDQHFIVWYMSHSMDINEAQWWPLLKTEGKEFVFVKVKIAWLRRLNLDITGYPETYSKEFHQIIP